MYHSLFLLVLVSLRKRKLGTTDSQLIVAGQLHLLAMSHASVIPSNFCWSMGAWEVQIAKNR